jgi:hypothetical protein
MVSPPASVNQNLHGSVTHTTALPAICQPAHDPVDMLSERMTANASRSVLSFLLHFLCHRQPCSSWPSSWHHFLPKVDGIRSCMPRKLAAACTRARWFLCIVFQWSLNSSSVLKSARQSGQEKLCRVGDPPSIDRIRLNFADTFVSFRE